MLTPSRLQHKHGTIVVMTTSRASAGSSAEAQFVVLNDEPVSSADADLMDTAHTVRRLAELVVDSRRSTPFTLSIDAGWGMGKSSLMRQVQGRLHDVAGTHTIWFNAWTSGTDALEVLIKSIFLQFDRNILRRAYNRIATNNRALSIVRASFTLFISAFGLRRLVDELWSQLSVDAKARQEIHQVVRDMAQDWSSAATSIDRQIVVFVDDLDRCSHEVVSQVCEAIKLYLDVPGLVFIIGCDQSALNHSIQRLGTSSQAAQYLEKIVQVNYQAPLPDQHQTRNLIEGYASQSGTLHLFGEQLSNFVAERTERNPRRIKRLINSFVLEYHLDSEWQRFGADALVRIILLQHFYPHFYRLLASPNGQDPVREYLNYRNVRLSIRRGETNDQNWKEVFLGYGLIPPPPEGTRSQLLNALEELEQEISEPVIRLAGDESFAALLTKLHESTEFEHLRGHLQRRRVRFDLHDETVGSASSDENFALTGVHVLLIDDSFDLDDLQAQFSDPGQLETTLRERGATVASAGNLTAAEIILRSNTPHIIVSDINRHGNDNAGLQDLQRLRDSHLYGGPVIFYVSRITPARRKWADDLGAVGVTNNPNEVLEWVRMAV